MDCIYVLKNSILNKKLKESKHKTLYHAQRHPHELYRIIVYNFSMKGSSVNLIFFLHNENTIMHMKYNYTLSLKK